MVGVSEAAPGPTSPTKPAEEQSADEPPTLPQMPSRLRRSPARALPSPPSPGYSRRSPASALAEPASPVKAAAVAAEGKTAWTCPVCSAAQSGADDTCSGCGSWLTPAAKQLVKKRGRRITAPVGISL